MKIVINVRKIKEGNDEYFLADSEDIKGLLVEGNSIEEVIELTPNVVSQLLTARKEKLTRQKLIEDRINTYKYLYSFA